MSLGIRSRGIWIVLSFLPLYATDYICLKPEISAWIISAYFIGVLLGALISTKITDKNQPLVLILSSTILTALLLLAITFIFLALHFLENKHDEAYKTELNFVPDRG